MAAEAQAERLLALEEMDAVKTAARAQLIAAFTAVQGYSADGDYSPRSCLIHRTKITKGAAFRHNTFRAVTSALSISAAAVRMRSERRHRVGSATTGGTAMRRIVVTEFLSLDGVMEEPRWTFDFDRGKEGDQFKYEELFAAESLLLGRVTYQGFAAAWPNMGGDDFGQRMNNIHKYVVSSTLADSDATWGPTTVLKGDDVAAEAAAIKNQPGGDLLVEGSARLVHTLAQHGLVDEYRLMVFPVILGQGKRVFPDTMPAAATLTLANARTVGSGVLLLNLTLR